MLDTTFYPNYKENGYDSLQREIYEALTLIAIESSENFEYVKDQITNFVKKNINNYKNVNFVYTFLERLEQKYYVYKSQNISIDEAIEKLKLIYN